MYRRGSRIKEDRSSVTGGATISIFIAGIDEAAHSGKDEEIPGAMHSTVGDHCPPG
jgi:hypothetical protein